MKQSKEKQRPNVNRQEIVVTYKYDKGILTLLLSILLHGPFDHKKSLHNIRNRVWHLRVRTRRSRSNASACVFFSTVK